MTDASGPRRKERDANDFSFPEFRQVEMNAQRESAIHAAAKLHASRNESDPFAYGRIYLHMKRGIANVGEVTADAKGIPLLE